MTGMTKLATKLPSWQRSPLLLLSEKLVWIIASVILKRNRKAAFEAQVKIAADEGKTLLVHDREASEDVLAIMGKFNLKAPVVIYCMTGPTEQIKVYLNRGYYIGITGFICKDSYGKHIREAIKNRDIPLSKIIVHSNAPYMVPNMPPAEQDPVSKSLIDLCPRDANEPCTL